MSEHEQADSRAVALYQGDTAKLHPLAKFGENKVVRALATRVMAADDRKIPLNENEALVVSQAAIVEGLSPFPPNPEIWAWVDIKDGRRILTIMRGRDGTIKVAKDNMKKAGTYMLAPRFRLLDEDEKIRYQVEKDALAVWCEVQDYRSVTDWHKQYATMADAGASDDTIVKRIGDIPTYTGLGVMTQQEMAKKKWGQMTHLERTEKRALTAALRKGWAAPEFQDLEDMEEYLSSIETEDYVIEGNFLEVDVDENETPDAKALKAQDARGTLYGEDEGVSNYNWADGLVKQLVGLFEPGEQKPEIVRAVLNRAPFKPDVPVKEAKRWVKLFNAYRYNEDMSIEDATKAANEKFEKAQG